MLKKGIKQISHSGRVALKDSVCLYFRMLGMSVRSQMQHRASFIMLTTAHFLSTFVDILGMWVLFDRFKMVKGWTMEEVALIYGIMHMGFALAENLGRGFDTFSVMVRNGDFDRVLLRPCGTLVQIASRDFQWMRMGRFLQGLCILIWGAATLNIPFFSLQSATIAISVIGTACLFYGLFIVQATLSFWTTETLELMNITTYGGLQMGQYPLDIYSGGFRLFFTFIIPFGFVAYFPVSAIVQHFDVPLWIGLILPAAGVIFLILTSQFWKLGVRHYYSSGS